jgi:dephospho-CoA kinase
MVSLNRWTRDIRLVIGIAGRIGAGKTSAARYLSSAYGLQYLRYSEVLAGWLAANSENKIELQTVGWEVMEKGLQAELNRRLIEQIMPGTSAVVDGLRHPLDYTSLHSRFGPSFHLIFLDVPFETRWEHVKGAGRHGTFEEFVAADAHSVEQQIELLRPHATVTIKNDGSLAELYTKMDSAMELFRKEGQV